jgi:hypothetical protein
MQMSITILEHRIGKWLPETRKKMEEKSTGQVVSQICQINF